MLNEKIDKLTPEEKILEILQSILYRINKIENKLDQLNDSYLKDYLSQNNKWSGYTLIDCDTRYKIIDSTQTDCKKFTIKENGEIING